MDSHIIHVDMDAFYAAVEQRDNPALKGKPVIVGADPKGRGVVSTCSYEARAYGVRSGMPISRAYKLCPRGVYLPVNMSKYVEASKQIRDIFYKYTPIVEPIALDEAFLDVTHSTQIWGNPKQIALMIQREIEQNTRLTASVGISYNKFLAKLASGLKKPKGFIEISRDNFKELVWPLPVTKVWGVGPRTKNLLEKLNIKTIYDLAKYPAEDLETILGKRGRQLHQLASGQDYRSVESDQEIKSIGKEITFDKDLDDIIIIKDHFRELGQRVGNRLRSKKLKAKCLSIKIRYNDFTTVTRSCSFSYHLSNDKELLDGAVRLFIDNWNGNPVRLIGVSVSNLIEVYSEQLSLFMDIKEDIIAQTIDNIRARYGYNIINRGSITKKTHPPEKEVGNDSR
ncbi:MAG: DNA polymerase IV [Bacillota bacterium]